MRRQSGYYIINQKRYFCSNLAYHIALTSAHIRKAYTQMHISIFLWGFTGILGKLIQLSEGLLVWYRMLLTALMLMAILLYRGELRLPPAKELWRLSGVGFVIMLHWVTFYGAIKYSNVSIALSCFSCSALFTALLEPLFQRRKVIVAEILFGLLAIVGIYLIFSFQKLYAIGIVLAIITAALSAAFTIMNKQMVDKHPPELITFVELSSGWIYLTLLLPIYLYYFPSPSILPSNLDWLWLFILSFFCTTIPFTLSLKALKKVSAFTLNLSVNLEPIYSIIMAIAIFHENKELTWGFYLGTAIILSSVVLHGLYKYSQTRKTA